MTSSPLLNQLIQQLRILPGVGLRSAQRMAFSLLKQSPEKVNQLSETLCKSISEIKFCESCRDYTENNICTLCQNSNRNANQICVVETPTELISIESSHIYSGKYFVLHGKLSPLDGIEPEDLGLDLFEKHLQNPELEEIILATNATVEGEATAYYLTELSKKYNKKVSRIAYGVPMGGELEFLDGQTLGHAIQTRQLV